MSLVGIITDSYPVDYGNYFSLGGYHVLNMWYENLEHLNIKKPYLDAVKFGDRHIVIVDEDIPDEYLNNDPCFTGGGGMTQEDYREVYEFMHPEYKDLDCMCNNQAGYLSVSHRSWGGDAAGIKLYRGICLICDRTVFKNNDVEVSEDIYNKLSEIKKEVPHEPIIFAPYVAVNIVDESSLNINPDSLSRYSKKKINSNFYKEIKTSNDK